MKSRFEVGQLVVCTSKDPWCNLIGEDNPGPKYPDYLIIKDMRHSEVRDTNMLVFSEYVDFAYDENEFAPIEDHLDRSIIKEVEKAV